MEATDILFVVLVFKIFSHLSLSSAEVVEILPIEILKVVKEEFPICRFRYTLFYNLILISHQLCSLVFLLLILTGFGGEGFVAF